MKKWILLTITIFSFTFIILYYLEGTMPANKNDTIAKNFVIYKGESLINIIKRLHKEGLIRDKIVFFVVIKQMGLENKIQAGNFRLSPSMKAQDIAKALTKGIIDEWVTIVEGLRKEEIASILSKKFEISEEEFIKNSKEGYLFPDTYLIPKRAKLKDILAIFQKNFEKKITPEIIQKAKNKNLSLNELITLASIVEREAKSESDRRIVASILLKRYKNGWPLDVDATVQYALGYQKEINSWWKPNLTKKDLEIDSPYNTYKYKGLPPSPIGNPGMSAIKAVIDADISTPYWFYISSKNGSSMHFAKTIKEQNENIAKYLK